MESITKQTEKNLVLKRLLKYLTIVIGSAIYAVGFQFFMFPNSIVSRRNAGSDPGCEARAS